MRLGAGRLMRPSGLVAVGAALVATIPLPMAAQRTGPAAGTWNVTWAQAVRINGDGSMDIQKWGTGTLYLQEDGDTVHGTWTTRVLETVTWQVSGTFRERRLTLEATENDSEDPQLAMIEGMRWRATLDGDRLDGRMTLTLRGATRERPWRPWRAERAPAPAPAG